LGGAPAPPGRLQPPPPRILYSHSPRAAALLSCFPALAYGIPPPHFHSSRDAAILRAVAERTYNHRAPNLARSGLLALTAPLPALSSQADQHYFGHHNGSYSHHPASYS
jgi:hypothetical protein